MRGQIPQSPSDARFASETNRIVIAAHIGFVFTGAITTLLGPLLPAFTARWSLTDSQAGHLFVTQFVGALLGTLLSGRIAKGLGTMRALGLGYLAVGAGITALAFGSATSSLFAVFTYGMGLGVTIPITNLFVSDLFPQRRAAALNILNLAWGLGAVLSPPILTRLILRFDLFWPLLGLGFFVFLVAVYFGVIAPEVPTVKTSAGRALSENRGIGFNRIVVMTCLLAFLYVGTENAISGWISSYMLRITTAGYAASAMAPSVFWGALLFGRLITPVVLRKLSGDRIVLAGLLIALVGTGMILGLSTYSLLLVAVVLCGFGLAPVFPTTIARFSERLGPAASGVAGIVFAMGAIGGATIPGLVGRVSTELGSLRAALLIPAIASSLMIALQLGLTVPSIQQNDMNTRVKPSH